MQEDLRLADPMPDVFFYNLLMFFNAILRKLYNIKSGFGDQMFILP